MSARAADHHPAGRPVGHQPPAELERRDQLRGLRLADPAQAGELQLVRRRESSEPVVRSEGVHRQVDGGAAVAPTPPHEADELGRGQATGPAQGEPLAGPFRGRHLPDGPTREWRARRGVEHVQTSRDPCGAAADGCPRGPNDGSPPIPPAIRTSKTLRSLRMGAHRRLIDGCTRPYRRGRGSSMRSARSYPRPERTAASPRMMRMPLNVACSPIGAQIDRRLR